MMLKWYDYIAIALVADSATGTILALLAGHVLAIAFVPLLALAWFSYEEFRVGQNNENRE